MKCHECKKNIPRGREMNWIIWTVCLKCHSDLLIKFMKKTPILERRFE